jgi:hypothetical protein
VVNQVATWIDLTQSVQNWLKKIVIFLIPKRNLILRLAIVWMVVGLGLNLEKKRVAIMTMTMTTTDLMIVEVEMDSEIAIETGDIKKDA